MDDEEIDALPLPHMLALSARYLMAYEQALSTLTGADENATGVLDNARREILGLTRRLLKLAKGE